MVKLMYESFKLFELNVPFVNIQISSSIAVLSSTLFEGVMNVPLLPPLIVGNCIEPSCYLFTEASVGPTPLYWSVPIGF